MGIVELLNKSIRISFYALFFLLPFIMHPRTHELFEFNKMWFVFLMALVILFLWAAKIIITKKIEIRRTPFDIPIALFLLSQIIATIFSIDQHTSFWGYYTRFNGGLLSTITYIFLYYAFSANLITQGKRNFSIKTIFTILASGVIVALWGFPSHFGLDPTCFVFRGELNISCWTDAFQPKIRIFSTLGQPNWLSAFLAILLPISIALAMKSASKLKSQLRFNRSQLFYTILYSLIAILFYVDLLWTKSQSGFIGFWIGLLVFIGVYKFFLHKGHKFPYFAILKDKSVRLLLFVIFIFLAFTFIIGNPIPKFNALNLESFTSSLDNQGKSVPQTDGTEDKVQEEAPQLIAPLSGSDSGQIRKYVWRGAIDIFKKNPLFGTGVETFAYAYYQQRPLGHNLTSEWDFLYNKAHNEYLDYLATTGAFGLGTYLLLIGWFLYIAAKHTIKEFKKKSNIALLPLALVAGYVSILITNFFGFSVVVINLLFFIIPLLYIDLTGIGKDKLFIFPPKKYNEELKKITPTPSQIMSIVVIGIIVLYLMYSLVNAWRADKYYALGYNLQRVSEFVKANESLENAVKIRPGEDLFKNELSINLATIALLFSQQGESSQAAQFAQRALDMSNDIVERNPNNISFFKARTRTLFTLSQIQPSLLNDTLDSIERAIILAPTDAKILYNKALLVDQAGRTKEAIEILDKTIRLKPNYKDAYYAQSLFLSQLTDEIKDKDSDIAAGYTTKAIKNLEFILERIQPNDNASQKLLDELRQNKQ